MTIRNWQSTSHENGKYLKHCSLDGRTNAFESGNIIQQIIYPEKEIFILQPILSQHFMWLSFRLLNALCKVLPSIFSIVLSSGCHLTQAPCSSYRRSCATSDPYVPSLPFRLTKAGWLMMQSLQSSTLLLLPLSSFDIIFNFLSILVSVCDLFPLSTWINIK